MKVLLGILIYLMIGVTLWVTGVTKLTGLWKHSDGYIHRFNTDASFAGQEACFATLLWPGPVFVGSISRVVDVFDPALVKLGEASQGNAEWSRPSDAVLWWIYGIGCVPAFVITARMFWKTAVLPLGRAHVEDYAMASILATMVAACWPAAVALLGISVAFAGFVKLSVHGLKTK